MAYLFYIPIAFLFAFMTERSHYFFFHRSLLIEIILYTGLISGIVSLLLDIRDQTLQVKPCLFSLLGTLIFVYLLPLRYDVSFTLAMVSSVINIISAFSYVTIHRRR